MNDQLFETPVSVRVALGDLSAPHDCTLRGIATRCHGGCCYARGGSYWPARIDPGPDGACAALGPDGCTLGEGRPVTCRLYPLHEHRGLWRLHFRTRLASSCCAGNHGEGPPLYEALRSSLGDLLAPGEFDRVVDACASGLGGGFTVSLADGVSDMLAEDRVASSEGRWPSYVSPPNRVDIRHRSR